MYERVQQRLVEGDTYTLAVSHACDVYIAEQSRKKALKFLTRQYNEAVRRGDTDRTFALWQQLYQMKRGR